MKLTQALQYVSRNTPTNSLLIGDPFALPVTGVSSVAVRTMGVAEGPRAAMARARSRSGALHSVDRAWLRN